MADVEIDRLTLRVPGLPAEQGHRLAELVAAGLERARFAPSQSVAKMTVELPSSGASLEQLAASIVAGLRRQMAQGA
ncbi:MAG TPA: hypothetical protein VJZ74_02130 [Pseudolabrys sp.]|nr:hypothetical protein [Pseudolabrys sp.]